MAVCSCSWLRVCCQQKAAEHRGAGREGLYLQEDSQLGRGIEFSHYAHSLRLRIWWVDFSSDSHQSPETFRRSVSYLLLPPSRVMSPTGHPAPASGAPEAADRMAVGVGAPPLGCNGTRLDFSILNEKYMQLAVH